MRLLPLRRPPIRGRSSVLLGAALVAALLSCAALPGRALGAETPVFTAAPGKGLGVSLPDGSFSLSLRARVQARDTLLYADDAATAGFDPHLTNELQIRTVRLWVSGNLLVPQLTYAVQLAFGGNDYETSPASSSPVFDAWVEYAAHRDLTVRAGQFFVPLDRLRTIRESALDMVDRAQPISELNLDRDVGLTLSSDDLLGLGGVLTYRVGLFAGEGRNRFGGVSGAGGLYVLRLGVRPMGAFDDDQEGDLARLPRARLALGVGAAYNQATSRQKSTFGTTLTLGTFDYLHAAADVIFKWRGLYLAAEWIVRQARADSLQGMAAGMPVREWSRSGHGFAAQASQMLGERVEVVGRYARLLSLGDTDPALIKLVAAQGSEVGGGLNVYLNGHLLKLQADYLYLFGDDLSRGRHQVRIQLDASL